MKRFFWGVIGLSALSFGIWLFSWGVRDARWDEESSSWPKAPGYIAQSFVQVTHGGKTGRGLIYTPKISYTYVVNGITYKGDDIMLGRIWSQADVNRVVQQFPTGPTPQISYSPSDPNRALLVPGLHISELAYVFLGLTAICISGLCCVVCIFFDDMGEIEGSSRMRFIPGTLGDRLSSPVLIGSIICFIMALAVISL